MSEREQELRMRCLEMASRGPHGGAQDIVQTAQKLYDFAMGHGPVEAKKAA